MDFQSRTQNNITIISISGRLDGVTAPDYETNIRAIIDGGSTHLVVDFAQIDYISSAGLHSLLMMAKLLKARNGAVCLANVGGNVKSVFDMSGFNSLFKITDSVTAALAEVS